MKTLADALLQRTCEMVMWLPSRTRGFLSGIPVSRQTKQQERKHWCQQE